MSSIRDLFITLGVDADLKTLKDVDEGIASIKSGAFKAGAAIASMGVAMVAAFTPVVKAGGEFEQLNVAFETMLGNTEDAARLLADIEKKALATPFSLKELERVTKQMLAYKFELNEILPSLDTFGNIAAGLGRDALPRLVRAVGQIRAKGVLKGQELLQLTETGLPIVDELSKITGRSIKEINDQTAKLGITFTQVMTAITNIADTKFKDLMAKQSKTMLGLISNLGIFVDVTLRRIGKEVNKRFKPQIEALFKFLMDNADEIQETLMKGFTSVADMLIHMFKIVKDNLWAVKALAAAFAFITGGTVLFGIGQIIVGLHKMGIAGLVANAKMLGGFIAIGAAVAALVLIMDELYTTIADPKADTFLRDFLNIFEEKLPNAFKVLKTLWESFTAVLLGSFDVMFKFFKNFATLKIFTPEGIQEVSDAMKFAVENFIQATSLATPTARAELGTAAGNLATNINGGVNITVTNAATTADVEQGISNGLQQAGIVLQAKQLKFAR